MEGKVPRKIQIKTNNLEDRDALIELLTRRGVTYSCTEKEGFYHIEYTEIVK